MSPSNRATVVYFRQEEKQWKADFPRALNFISEWRTCIVNIFLADHRRTNRPMFALENRWKSSGMSFISGVSLKRMHFLQFFFFFVYRYIYLSTFVSIKQIAFSERFVVSLLRSRSFLIYWLFFIFIFPALSIFKRKVSSFSLCGKYFIGNPDDIVWSSCFQRNFME